MYTLRCKNLDTGRDLFWNNDDGWQSRKSLATRYNRAERDTFDLPTGNHVKWSPDKGGFPPCPNEKMPD